MRCPEEEDVGPGKELLLWHGMRPEDNCFRVQGLPRAERNVWKLDAADGCYSAVPGSGEKHGG